MTQRCDNCGTKCGRSSEGTPPRDHMHVLDLADADVIALKYLVGGGTTSIFNLGSDAGYSIKEVVATVTTVLERPDFEPNIGSAPGG